MSDSKWQPFLGFIMVCITIGITAVYISKSNYTYTEPLPREWSDHLPLAEVCNITNKGTKEMISVLATLIHSAKKHVRGSKTSDYLQKAISVMDNILIDINVDAERVYERSSMKSEHVCPETYMGGGFGYPLYYNGFETDSCNKNVSLSKLVTVIRYMDTNKNDAETPVLKLDHFLLSVYETMVNVSTLVAVNSAEFLNNQRRKYPMVNIIQSNSQSEGAALNSLIKKVKTPYVLVARSIDSMTIDSRLERLVREIESLNVVAVGGAFRDSNGHWKKGCFQSVYRNYTLEYFEGYDESLHECLFCDYIHGPFVTTTRFLKQNTFRNFNKSNGLYEDWFLRVFQGGEEAVVCPDSMFHVDNQIMQTDLNWEQFAHTWDVFKIITTEGYTFTQSCENQKISSRASQALSPCALQINSDAVKIIMGICEETGVMCELEDGTTLGAVKLGKALPWDVDYDIRFLSTNCSMCQHLERALKKAELKFRHFASSCCTGKLKHGEIVTFAIYYKGYYGDFTGHPVMDSDLLSKAGLTPTKILFDGQWVNVPRNPGMFVRNRYGKEIYQHAEHWRYTGGKTGRFNYKTNVFLPCKQPGGQDCLDRYNADGDLPFVGIFP